MRVGQRTSQHPAAGNKGMASCNHTIGAYDLDYHSARDDVILGH